MTYIFHEEGNVLFLEDLILREIDEYFDEYDNSQINQN